MGIQDFTKSAENILLQLIKQDNPVTAASLTEEIANYGDPTPVTAGQRNSTIKVTPTPGKGYRGAVDIDYNRVDIGTVPAGRDSKFVIGSATKLSQLVPAINARYKINLIAGDFVDVDLAAFSPTEPNQSQDVQLAVVPLNKCFIGFMLIQVVTDEIDLAVVIVNRVLNGLTYAPDPTP